MFAPQTSGLALQGSRTTGSDVRSQNVTAVTAVANIVKSSLGPVGLDKVRSGGEREEEERRRGDDDDDDDDGRRSHAFFFPIKTHSKNRCSSTTSATSPSPTTAPRSSSCLKWSTRRQR